MNEYITELSQLLNHEQFEAATQHLGAIVVRAGAGSGKTRVIAYRIAHLINFHHIHPSRILALTFTNKAAKEMRERVVALLHNQQVSIPTKRTFHSYAFVVLKKYLKTDQSWTILDDDDQTALINKLLKDNPAESTGITTKRVLNYISSVKNGMMHEIANPRDGAYFNYIYQLNER
jgi:DNA helicase-2/ATP-dependent DNA helicase PcrA